MKTLAEKIEESNNKYGEIKSESTGSEDYVVVNRLFGQRFIMTSGVFDTIEANDCNWFLDIVGSYLPKIAKSKQHLVVCRIIKNLEGNGCLFVADNGNYEKIVSQRIDYTDLEKNLRMYLCFDGERWTIMMPSEY